MNDNCDFAKSRKRSTHILIAPKSGAKLHYRLLSTVIEYMLPQPQILLGALLICDRASLAFFSTNDTGVILNRWVLDLNRSDYSRLLTDTLSYHRFSQDLELIDRQLPPAVLALSTRKMNSVILYPLANAPQRSSSLPYRLRCFSVHRNSCLSRSPFV